MLPEGRSLHEGGEPDENRFVDLLTQIPLTVYDTGKDFVCLAEIDTDPDTAVKTTDRKSVV